MVSTSLLPGNVGNLIERLSHVPQVDALIWGCIIELADGLLLSMLLDKIAGQEVPA